MAANNSRRFCVQNDPRRRQRCARLAEPSWRRNMCARLLQSERDLKPRVSTSFIPRAVHDRRNEQCLTVTWAGSVSLAQTSNMSKYTESVIQCNLRAAMTSCSYVTTDVFSSCSPSNQLCTQPCSCGAAPCEGSWLSRTRSGYKYLPATRKSHAWGVDCLLIAIIHDQMEGPSDRNTFL